MTNPRNRYAALALAIVGTLAAASAHAQATVVTIRGIGLAFDLGQIVFARRFCTKWTL